MLNGYLHVAGSAESVSENDSVDESLITSMLLILLEVSVKSDSVNEIMVCSQTSTSMLLILLEVSLKVAWK